jgi:hypothetical protein
MSTIVKKIWTQTLTASTITIDQTYGLTEVSLLLISGTGSVTGTGFAGSISSSPISLPVGVGFNIGSGSSNALLDGVTITTTGVIALVGR